MLTNPKILNKEGRGKVIILEEPNAQSEFTLSLKLSDGYRGAAKLSFDLQ